MLRNVEAETLLRDAYAMQAAAERRLDAGDWRDAAEKGWLAARNGAKALLLEVNGAAPLSPKGGWGDSPRTPNIPAGLRHLAHRRGGAWQQQSDHLAKLAYQLHSEAFYGGVYVDDIPALVRGVAAYLRQTEELAG